MINIIIDCDPGQDDAIALLMAMASANLNILGITTVAGNVCADLTFFNARKMCACASRYDIKVFKGCEKPLIRDLITAEHIHGANGLSCDINADFMQLESEHAVDFIINKALQAKENITIAATASLTNIATALQKSPKIKDKIEKIVLMGGSTENGNITPYAEFNFFLDPHAANIVFESGIDITMIGLNVTNKVMFTEHEINKISKINNPVADRAVTILNDLLLTNKLAYGIDGGIVHDGCVVAYLNDPNMFNMKRARVSIETVDKEKMGHSHVDFSSDKCNANVAVDINVQVLFNLVESLIDNYKERAVA